MIEIMERGIAWPQFRAIPMKESKSEINESACRPSQVLSFPDANASNGLNREVIASGMEHQRLGTFKPRKASGNQKRRSQKRRGRTIFFLQNCEKRYCQSPSGV
jgi:hypothetical protein